MISRAFAGERIREAWAVALLALLVAIVCGPLATAGWQVQDDHAIIRNAFSAPLHPQSLGPRDAIRTLIDEGIPSGRFFPFTIVARQITTSVVGVSAVRLHVAVLVLGWLTLVALYRCARVLDLSRSEALLVPVLAFLAPDAFSNWYRLGTGELWGMACLAAALLSAVTARRSPSVVADTALLFFAVLAGLSKESFVPVILAVACLRAGVLCAGREPTAAATPDDSRRQTRIVVALLLGSFVILSTILLAVSVTAGGQTEGGGAVAGSVAVTLKTLSASAAAVAILGGGWVPLLVLLTTHTAAGGDASRRRHLLALAALWVIPQVVIYHDRGGPLQRFALPASAGIALVLAQAISELRRRRVWLVPIGLWLSAWLGAAMLHAVKAASAERANAVTLTSMVRDLAESAPTDSSIAVVIRPAEIERAATLITLLGLGDRPDISVYYVRAVEGEDAPSLGREWLVKIQENLHRQLETTYFRGRREGDLDLGVLEAVVYYEDARRTPEDWLSQLDPWQQVRWCAPLLTGNLRKGSLIAKTEACHGAFVRPGSSLTASRCGTR
jgi:hypothetical protein